jgi:membrane protein
LRAAHGLPIVANCRNILAFSRDPGEHLDGQALIRLGRLRRWIGWVIRLWAPLLPTLARINSHRTALMAAGCAFYATLALFPAITMLISLYGLAFNPRAAESQLVLLRDLLPPEAYTLIARQVHALVRHSHGTLTINFSVGAAITLWTAATGTKSMLAALNLAYEETERRGLLRFQLIGMAMTFANLLSAAAALAVLVALPAVAGSIGLPHRAAGLIHIASLGIMVLFVALMLAVLYWIGPSRRPRRQHRVLPGTILATLLWLAASELFSLYVARIGRLDITYGPVGAVAGVMLWFWVSAYAVLAGAELNSALERAASDSSE